jgi:phosphosulfolactate phosphohydrolase-like enzyme
VNGENSQHPSSPDVQAVLAAYHGPSADLGRLPKGCGSGEKLIERGHEDEVELALKLGVSTRVPMPVDEACIHETA